MRRLLRRRRGTTEPRDLVLVDGSNVRRSGWPNATEDELVAALDAWDGAGDAELVVVFDSREPIEPTLRVTVVCVPYADDDLVSRARTRVELGAAVRVATSDRELRRRLEEAGAEVAWGGGRLLRELGLVRRR